MGVGGKGKGTKGGMVRHNDVKKGAGKTGGKSKGKSGGKSGGKAGGNVEKRTDPSDGNGPFAYSSFIRFHGQVKGDNLWKAAAKEQGQETANKGHGKKPQQKEKGKGKKASKGEGGMPDNKTKGKNSKGKGKGKKAGKSNQEKRVDPSDGNGPFTKASFIRFHGDAKGLQLWEEAEPQADFVPDEEEVELPDGSDYLQLQEGDFDLLQE